MVVIKIRICIVLYFLSKITLHMYLTKRFLNDIFRTIVNTKQNKFLIVYKNFKRLYQIWKITMYFKFSATVDSWMLCCFKRSWICNKSSRFFWWVTWWDLFFLFSLLGYVFVQHFFYSIIITLRLSSSLNTISPWSSRQQFYTSDFQR